MVSLYFILSHFHAYDVSDFIFYFILQLKPIFLTFFRSFPVATYQPLLDAFLLVLRSGRSVASATSSFRLIIEDMAHRDEKAFLLEQKIYVNLVRKRQAKAEEGLRKELEMNRVQDQRVEREGEVERGGNEDRKNDIHDGQCGEIISYNDFQTSEVVVHIDTNDGEVESVNEVENEVQKEGEAWGGVEIHPCDEKDFRKFGKYDLGTLVYKDSFREHSYPELEMTDKYSTFDVHNDNKSDNTNYGYNNSNSDNNNNNNSNNYNFMRSSSNKLKSKTISGKCPNKSEKRTKCEIAKTDYETVDNNGFNAETEFSRSRSMSEAYFMENQLKQALVPLHLKTFTYMHTHLLGELQCLHPLILYS